MTDPMPVLSLVTLGVTDLARSIAFYERLGFRRKARGAQGVGFFQAGSCIFAVWPTNELARDAEFAQPIHSSNYRGVALAWNCLTEEQVDNAVSLVWTAGGQVQKPPQKTSWGGYAGYFTDPDGHLWEVAHNPAFPLSADGRLTLPD